MFRKYSIVNAHIRKENMASPNLKNTMMVGWAFYSTFFVHRSQVIEVDNTV